MNWTNQCHFGDVRDVLRRMIADGVKVQTIVTSPPYWGLRSYLPAGHPDKAREIGSEPTLGEFLSTTVGVFDLCRQVLADDGTMWVNMGDSYASGGRASYDTKSANRGNEGAIGNTRPSCHEFKPKDLIGQPWRLAFALQDAGWYLRQDIIWHKPNPMPESVTDRCTKAHEYLFLLAKSERYFFDHVAIQEPETMKPQNRLTPRKANPDAKVHGMPEYRQQEGGTGGGMRNRRSVWSVNTAPYGGAHFATFPPALIEPCVLAGSRPGDVVLDPFMGSGTTAQVAEKLGRKWIGIDIDIRNKALQAERLRQPSLDLEAA